MTIKANIQSGYRWRPGMVGVLSILFGAWFLYDGYHAWPREREIARQFAAFQADGRADEWPTHAAKMGWPDGRTGTPGKDRSDLDLMVQKVLGFALLTIGVFFAVGFVRTLGRWIALDDNAFSTSWGQAVPLDSIVAVQLDRWQAKGLAVITYKRDGGENRLILDDWKYDRAATTAMVEQVKLHLGMDSDDPG